jgi:hypothetical protein
MLLLILPLMLSSALLQTRPADTPRPVRDVTTAPSLDELDLSFSFEEPGIYHVMTAHFSAIDGEPAAGGRYGVQATVSGLRSVASMRFELIDEKGTVIGPVPMVIDESWGFIRYIGMVNVPERPFRVRLVGMSVDGKRFQGTYRKLFRPARPHPTEKIPGLAELPPQMSAMFPRLLAEATAAREAQVKGVDGGAMMRIPQLRVTNVSFMPYRSSSGRTLGLQVFYDVEFERMGRFSPGAYVAQMYPEADFVWHDFRPVTSAISPAPHLAHDPSQLASATDQRLGGTDFLYTQGIRYSFRMLLVPDFVERHGPQRTFCVFRSRFTQEGELARMLRITGPAPYRVRINQDTFDGMIDAFDSEGVLYQNWLDEGTPPCPTYDGRP